MCCCSFQLAGAISDQLLADVGGAYVSSELSDNRSDQSSSGSGESACRCLYRLRIRRWAFLVAGRHADCPCFGERVPTCPDARRLAVSPTLPDSSRAVMAMDIPALVAQGVERADFSAFVAKSLLVACSVDFVAVCRNCRYCSLFLHCVPRKRTALGRVGAGRLGSEDHHRVAFSDSLSDAVALHQTYSECDSVKMPSEFPPSTHHHGGGRHCFGRTRGREGRLLCVCRKERASRWLALLLPSLFTGVVDAPSFSPLRSTEAGSPGCGGR